MTRNEKIRTRFEWETFAFEKGTTGEMVLDILVDWKLEREKIREAFKEILFLARTHNQPEILTIAKFILEDELNIRGE